MKMFCLPEEQQNSKTISEAVLEAKAAVDSALPALPYLPRLPSLAEPWAWLPLPEALGRISQTPAEDCWEKGV